MTDEREDRIRARAHETWQREGSPEEREHDYWRQAEQEIEAETTGAGAGISAANDDAAPQSLDRTGSAAAKI